MVHATKWLRENNENVRLVCCIYATAPFIQKDDLLNAYEVFKKNNYSFVFPATTFPFPIKRAFKKLKEWRDRNV